MKLSKFIFFLLISNYHSILISKKEAVFIIGTGRSGTSCAAFVLKTLGIPFGNKLTPPNQWNIKGTFEDINTINVNNRILQQMGLNNHTVRFINWQTHPKYSQFKQMIKNHLSNNFGKFDRFCIKNPQISYFLPLYLEAAYELGYTPKTIVMIRKPKEIAQSFAARTNLPPIHFYPIICDCYQSIMTYGHDYPQLVIKYEDLLFNLSWAVEQIRTFIPNLKTFDEVETTLHSFLNPNLQHQKKMLNL